MEMEQEPKPKEKKLTKTLVLGTFLASLGSFQHGFTLWIIRSPQTIFVPDINSSLHHRVMANYGETQKLLVTLTVITYPAGGLTGCLLLRIMTDSWGRKTTLMVSNAVAAASAFIRGLSRIAKLYNVNILARFITGVCEAVYAGVVPLYIGEIAPTNLRGALIVVSILFFTAGIGVAQVMCLPEVLANDTGFPLLVSFSGVIALFNGPLLIFSPSSPRYLFIQKNNKEKAREVLQKLRDHDDVEDEMAQLQEEDECEMEEKYMTVFRLLSFRPLQRSLLCAAVVMAGQQLAGINGAYFFAEEIYQSLEIGFRSDLIAVCVVFSLLLVNVITMLTVDHVGRKFLFLMGLSICCTVCILLTLSLELQVTNPLLSILSTFLVISFIAGHIIGPASIPYIMTVELFLQSSRASACAISGLVNWSTRLCSELIFVLIEPLTGSYSLLILWPFCVATFIYSFINMPETKQKTFVQIHDLMKNHSKLTKPTVEA